VLERIKELEHEREREVRKGYIKYELGRERQRERERDGKRKIKKEGWKEKERERQIVDDVFFPRCWQTYLHDSLIHRN